MKSVVPACSGQGEEVGKRGGKRDVPLIALVAGSLASWLELVAVERSASAMDAPGLASLPWTHLGSGIVGAANGCVRRGDATDVEKSYLQEKGSPTMASRWLAVASRG